MWQIIKPISYYGEGRSFLWWTWMTYWVRAQHISTGEIQWRKVSWNELEYQIAIDQLDQIFKKGVYDDSIHRESTDATS